MKYKLQKTNERKTGDHIMQQNMYTDIAVSIHSGT
jgi:hypothetical protein